METKEIIENNKLIAEFMGSKYIDCSYTDKNNIYYNYWEWSKPKYCKYPQSIGIGELSTAWTIGNFYFNDSWDWLMPVVEKIESLGFWTKIGAHTSFNNKYKSFDIKKIKPKSDGEYIYNYEGDWNESKIDAVYCGVVEFIKWFNNH